MFATISCCITPHHAKEAQQSPMVLKNPQLLGMIADAAFAAIMIATGVCILLAASGVNIGALNALSTMGTMAAWILIGVAGGVIIGNFIGLALISIKSAKEQHILYQELQEAVGRGRRHVRFATPIEDQSEAAQTEIRNKDETIARLYQEIEQLHARSDANASSEELTAQLRRLEQEKETWLAARENLTGLAQQVRELESEQSSLRSELEHVRASEADLNRQKEQLENRIQKLQRLENQASIDEAAAASKQRELRAQQAELSALSRQISQKQTELEVVARQISGKRSELEELTIQLDDDTQGFEELQEELSSMEDKITLLTTKISEKETKLEELTKQIALQESKIENLEGLRQFSSVYKRMDPASAQSTSGIMRKSRPPSGENEAPIDTAQLQSELSEMADKARHPNKKKLNKEVASKTAELNRLKTEIQEKQSELDNLNASLTRGRESTAEMGRELERLQQCIVNKAREKARIETQFAEARRSLNETRQELEEARRELSKAEEAKACQDLEDEDPKNSEQSLSIPEFNVDGIVFDESAPGDPQ